ncbi:MAG TPA: 4Fe-4S dicluster domain-containing protein [Conexivisphaerales archaeon]|nr:4Fe-4S dicluster domain-containing protein [Conexivisphaerales archaeon]
MKMDRRTFLKTAAAGGGLVVVTAATAPRIVRANTPSRAMLIVVGNCIGCDHCVEACTQYHEGKAKPDLSAFRGQYPSFNPYTKVATAGPNQTLPIPQNCLHCNDAPCVTVCQSHALTQLPSGTVTYDKDRCIGCFLCTSVCPFGSITTDNANKKILRCDHCVNFTEDGQTSPFCVQVCPGGGPTAQTLKAASLTTFAKNWGSTSDMVSMGQKVVTALGNGATMLYQNDTSTFYVLTGDEFKTMSASSDVTVVKSAYPSTNRLVSTAEEWVRLAWIPLLAGVAFFALRWRDSKQEKPMVVKPEEEKVK